MVVSPQSLLSLVTLIPLGAICFFLLFRKYCSRRLLASFGLGCLAVNCVIALRLFSLVQVGVEAVSVTWYTWAVIGNFHVDVGFYADQVSVVISLLVAGYSFLSAAYGYFCSTESDEWDEQFIRLVTLSTTLLVMVLSDNLLLMFAAWQLLAAVSWWHSFQEGSADGLLLQRQVIGRIGDLTSLMSVIVLLFHCEGTAAIEVLRWACESGDYGPFHDPDTVFVCCLLLITGVCARAAQVPFHVGVSEDTGESTAIWVWTRILVPLVAGTYVIVRLSFLFTLSPTAMAVLATTGAISAVLGAMFAFFQTSIRRVLAYVVVSQTGCVFVALGVGSFSAAIFHSITQSLIIGLLALVAGAVVAFQHDGDEFSSIQGMPSARSFRGLFLLVALVAASAVPFSSVGFSGVSVLTGTLSRSQQLTVPAQPSPGWSNGKAAAFGGRLGVVISTEDGENWQREQLPPTSVHRGPVSRKLHPTIRGLSQSPDGTLWAVADFCTIYRKNSLGMGGWQHAFQPQPDDPEFPGATRFTSLNSTFALADNDVWFVGDRGVVIHFDGEQFRLVDVGHKVNLNAVAGLSPSELYVAGAGGVIVHFDGTDWKRVPGPGTANITSLSVIDGQLFGTNIQGTLMNLGSNGHWNRLPLKAENIDTIAGLHSVISHRDSLVVGGIARLKGAHEASPVFISRTSGEWSVVAGTEGGVRGLMSTEQGLWGVGTGRRVFGVEGSHLVAQSHLSHKPAFHDWLAVLVLFAFFVLAVSLLRLHFMVFVGPESPSSMKDSELWVEPLNIKLLLWSGLICISLLPFNLADSFQIHSRRLDWLQTFDADVTFGLLIASVMLGIAVAWHLYSTAEAQETALRVGRRFESTQSFFRDGFRFHRLYSWTVGGAYRLLSVLLGKVLETRLLAGGLFMLPNALARTLGRAAGPLTLAKAGAYGLVVVVIVVATLFAAGGGAV